MQRSICAIEVIVCATPVSIDDGIRKSNDSSSSSVRCLRFERRFLVGRVGMVVVGLKSRETRRITKPPTGHTE